MEDYRLEQTGQEVQRILNGAAMEANLQAEVERATEAEGRLQGNIDVEEQARQDADSLLQQGIDDEAQRAKDAEEANAGEIEGIKALIPSTATSANKLADTNYVNSSIQTATAEYRGDYNVVTDLHLAIDATHAQIETLLPTVIAEADKNDYCYVMIPTNAQTPTEIAKIERYKMTSEGWKFEYDVNNSTFTAEEWAAIKSGITSGLVGKLNALPTNADLLLLLAGKQDVLTFDSVPVPESNNPVKSGGVYSAIDDEKTARLNSDTAIHAELDGLQAKVPATASSDNKLVDQNQMNSSISTATATYRGDWNVVSDLHLAVDATRTQIAALLPTVISTADNNDYCYVEIPTSAENPTQIERVERFKFNGTAWAYEYVLNNSGFTAAQWAAINSMITSGLVAKLTALPTNADLLAMLAQKQDNLTFDSTPTENSTNPVTSGGVFAADKALSDAIEAILLLIPSAASALNKLVDTAQMNSSISTATATFRGTYNLVSNLGLGIDATEGEIAAALLANISTADNNDYAFVQIPTSAQTPTQIARTDRYKFNGTAWGFEYTLNTSGFTADQWAAINSTITSALVAKLSALPTAAELQEALGVLTSGITAINQKIPSTASQSNKLVDNASMESYIAQVINILDASFNVTSTDGHITLHITQVDGVITSVQVQSTDIASAADLALNASQITALASRVTTAEGNITSLTGRMGTAETNIANLQQLYYNLQQSKPVPVTALPSTGQQQGVIYRLAGTTSYSDYMWNGSSWVLMATYNNAIDPLPKKASQNLVTSGGVFDNIGAFDVSELNATENPHTLAQYADLSAALADIPTDYQKGGMSIKYVQTSDNKYVQFRCMAQNFTTDTTQWQGVDDEPTAGSENLVESGGVERKLAVVSNISKIDDFTLEQNLNILSNGTTSANAAFNSYHIKNQGYTTIFVKAANADTNRLVIAFYSSNTVGEGFISGVPAIKTGSSTEEVHEYSAVIPNNCKTIAVCNKKNGSLSIPEIFLSGNIVLSNRIEDAESRISSHILVGQGRTRSFINLYCLQPKQAYTLVFKNKDWDLTGTGTSDSDNIIQIRTYINNEYSSSLRVVYRSTTKQQSYSFVTPATFDCVRISILAAVDTEVPFTIVPMDVNSVQIYTNQGLYIEEDETNNKVFCKVKHTIYSRAEWSDLTNTLNNSQLLTNMGVLGVTSTLGVSDCFELDTTYSFVFDVVNKKFSIVNREDVSPFMIVLIESVSGKINRFYNGIFTINKDILDYGFTGIFVREDVDSKIREYCSLLNTNGVCDTLLFFTDPHLMGIGDMSYLEVLKYKQYIGLLQKYYNSAPADLIICGGDWLNNGDTQEQACRKLGMIDSTMRKLFKNYLPVIGNHDSNNQGVVSSEDSSNGRLSNQAMVNLLFRNEKKAYYEYISDNTKYIVLDTQIGVEVELDAYAWGQIAWLAGRLNENTNEHIVIVQHIFKQPNGTTPILFVQNEMMLLEAFNARGTVELNGVTYDFTNAQGKVHCIIAGHTHYDATITSGNIPVWLTTTMQDEDKPTFDMLVIDYGNYKLKSVRVGTGSNREMNLAH